MKSRVGRSILAVLFVFALVLAAACQAAPTPTATPKPTTPPQPTQPAAQPTQPAAAQPTQPPADTSPIKIGWIGAKSGTGAMLGEWDTRGIMLVFEAVNAAGGIHGRQLELIQYDDEADPTKAVGLAEKVCTEDKVVAAFATTNSTPTLAVVPIFAKYKIPHITGGIAANITQQGSAYVFRDTAVGTIYESTIVDYLVEKGFTKYAIIADNAAYGQGEADAQEAALKTHNLTALTREIYALEDKDFTGQLTKIMTANPEVLLCAGQDIPCGLIIKQARSLGFEGTFAGPGSLGTSIFIETAGDAAEGTLYSAPYISNEQSDLTKDFAVRYQARWNDTAESHGAKAYDGAMTLVMALNAAYPDITGENVAAEMHKICGYEGLQGEFCFDATGEGVQVMNIGVIKNGQLQSITQEAPTAGPADTSPIKIGWIGAKSGTGAMLGEWDTRGIMLVFEAVNAAGGIHGRQLELIQYDDEADPTKAVGLAEKVCTEDKVVAAFATTNSTPTLAVVPIFAKYKIPHITGGIAANITQQGSAYVFRDTAVGTIYESTIVDYLVQQGFSKYAIIADNAAYGQGEADAQEAALKAHNLTALTREIYALEDKDFTGQLTKIMVANPEVLLCAGQDIPCGLIIKQARSLGFEGTFAGPGSLGTSVFIETAGDAAEGTLYSAPYISNEQSDLTKDFAARYQARWNDTAESHGAKAYDGAMALVMALNAAYPNITGENVAAEMHKICGYQGLQGEFCFDATGEGVQVMNIGVIEDGQLQSVTQ